MWSSTRIRAPETTTTITSVALTITRAAPRIDGGSTQEPRHAPLDEAQEAS